jgi:uncharacterized membrane protein YphA (DoxX/SURF4 family)
MKIIRNISRILVGIVFIFSGFVKGVDPMGTVFRIEDYFAAFGTTWANPMAPFLTVFLCTLEFTLGISLLFNLKIRWASWLVLLMMTYFTVLTLFDALFNLVPDCGCFGEAVKLTNTQTFLKNLVLMVLVLVIFVWRARFRPGFSGLTQWAFLVVAAGLFSGMMIYAYRHLPIIDFMDWRVGKTVNRTIQKPAQFYVTYKNRKTGETKEYLAPNYPWNDSVWMSEWVFVSQRAAGGQSQQMTLQVEDREGNDVTQSILGNPDYQLIAVSWDLAHADAPALKKLYHMYVFSEEDGYSFSLLTSTLPAEADTILARQGILMPFYLADDAVLKTMVRSNPGLILLKDGVVIKKWAFRDLPNYDKMVAKYFK